MAWLKFDVTTPEKPEVLAITIAMGWEDPDLTVGKLLKVWRWFDQHTIDGNAPSVTPALLDRLIGVTGLTQAIANSGWLLIHDGGLTLPNFETHNGKTAKDRALTASRVAKSKGNAKGNGGSVTPALPREEKRREDISTPIPPTGDEDKVDKKQSAISLPTWLDSVKAKGEKPIPENDPVFTYAEQAGIPPEHLRLCWKEFRERYSQPGSKKYKDWRSVFRKAVRGNWFKLWWVDGSGEYSLTTVGKQAERLAA